MGTRTEGAPSTGRDWLTVVRRRGWIIAQVIVVGLLAGVIAGRLQPEVYEAHSELAIYSQERREAGPGEQPAVSAAVQVRMLRSPEVLERVADRVGTGKTPAAIADLQRRIDVRTDESENTTIVLVYVQHGRPQQAADIANAAADAFVEESENRAKISSSQALVRVQELVKSTEEKLASSEDRIESFKKQESPVVGADDAGASMRTTPRPRAD